MQVLVGAQTDVGLVREHNEDNFFVGHQIWAVADGMGGQAAGDMASTIVSEQLRVRDSAGPLAPDEMRTIIAAINRTLIDYARVNPTAAGLGSTLTGIASVELDDVAHWSIFNVGDSRVYRFAEGRMTRQTVDHNEAEELIEAGVLDPDDALVDPSRFVLTRALGTSPPPQPDIFLMPQSPDETFLICSDGLTSEVKESVIADVLRKYPDPKKAAARLINLTLKAGAHDNVTVIVIVIKGKDATEDSTTLPRSDVQEVE